MPDTATTDDTGQDADRVDGGLDASQFDAEFDSSGYDGDIDGLNSLSSAASTESTDAAASESAAESDPEPMAWATNGHRLLAERIGFTDDDLRGFRSADEFERAAAIVHRQQQEWLGQIKAKPQSAPPAAPAQPGEPEGGAAPAAEQLKPWHREGKLLNPDFYRTGNDEFTPFDDATMALVEAVAETQQNLRSVLDFKQQFERAIEQQQDAEYSNQLHDVFDSLDPDFFGVSLVDGKPVEITDEQVKRRDMIREAMEKIFPIAKQEAEILGGPLPTFAELAERVYRRATPAKPAAPAATRQLAAPAAPPAKPTGQQPLLDKNGDRLHGAALESRQDALRRQSAMRRPAGSHRGMATPGKPVDPKASSVQRLLANEEVQESFNRMRQSFGL
jgi:hypothetical protein